MVNKEYKYSISICYTPNELTNEFKLPNFTNTDDTEIRVVINDEEIVSDSYTIDNNKIIFENYYINGDIVKIYCDIVSKTPKTIISNNPKNIRSLFNTNNTDNTMYENTHYNLKLFLKDELIETEFTTKLKSLYSDISSVRRDTGSFLNEISDKDILKFLYENTIAIEEIVSDLEEKGSDVTATDRDKVLWVRYKTDLDLLYVQYLNINNRYGTQSKKVGPIDIEKTTKLPYLDKLLKGIQDKFDEVNNKFIEINIASSFVKAGNTQYPLSERNSF